MKLWDCEVLMYVQSYKEFLLVNFIPGFKICTEFVPASLYKRRQNIKETK